jgi:hypothetical protein
MIVFVHFLQMVIDHDEDNLSDKETFSKNIPAIGKHFKQCQCRK